MNKHRANAIDARACAYIIDHVLSSKPGSASTLTSLWAEGGKRGWELKRGTCHKQLWHARVGKTHACCTASSHEDCCSRLAHSGERVVSFGFFTDGRFATKWKMIGRAHALHEIEPHRHSCQRVSYVCLQQYIHICRHTTHTHLHANCTCIHIDNHHMHRWCVNQWTDRCIYVLHTFGQQAQCFLCKYRK